MAKAPTIITSGIVVSGRIEGAEDIEVFGAVKGSVHLDGDLFVDENARLDADLEVNNLVIHGIVVGNITAGESVELSASARVIGDITSPRVIIQSGARYRGAIDMGDIEDEIPGDASASRKTSGSRSRRAASSRPAAAPAKPAPAAKKTSTRKRKPAPAPVVEEIDDVDDIDDEPELPAAAAKKKVAVKKRGS